MKRNVMIGRKLNIDTVLLRRQIRWLDKQRPDAESKTNRDLIDGLTEMCECILEECADTEKGK